jgi:hypothetical protein
VVVACSDVLILNYALALQGGSCFAVVRLIRGNLLWDLMVRQRGLLLRLRGRCAGDANIIVIQIRLRVMVMVMVVLLRLMWHV